MTQTISREQLLQRLCDFEGAGQDARAIEDDGYAQECEEVASIIREVLQYRQAAMGSEPPSFDELRDAVAEMTGGLPIQWSEITEKGHQVVPFINFNSLARIVDKFRAAAPAPVAVPELRAAVATLESMGYTWNGGQLWKPPLGKAPTYITDEEAELVSAPVVATQQNMRAMFCQLDDGECAIAADVWNACRAAMQAEPVSQRYTLPEGWKLVPVEPTEKMVIEGFESEPDEFFSDEDEWKKYQDMSGCEQAAHRAKLCWSAMLAASPAEPEQEV